MFKTKQGLSYNTTATNFTLLIRHHTHFWGIILGCFIACFATLELEDAGFWPIHQKITCTRELDGCQYTKVQLHPLIFWQSENTFIPLDTIEASLYDPRFREWEIEFADRSIVFKTGGSKVKAQAQRLSDFLREKNDFATASSDHGFIGFLQLLMWMIVLFPVYLLLLDRSGRPHSTQSIYADKQAIIVKRYNFLGMLKQKTYPTRSVQKLTTSLQTKKNKHGETYFIHFKMIDKQGKKVPLVVKVPTDNLYKKQHKQAFDHFTQAATAMTDFLNTQGVEVTLSVVS